MEVGLDDSGCGCVHLGERLDGGDVVLQRVWSSGTRVAQGERLLGGDGSRPENSPARTGFALPSRLLQEGDAVDQRVLRFGFGEVQVVD